MGDRDMTSYLVFPNKAEADYAEMVITVRSKGIAKQLGFTVDSEGIVGNRDGQPDPEATRSERWDVPRQRLDGKWVILDTATHPNAQADLGGRTYLETVMLGLTYERETDDGTWFAVPESSDQLPVETPPPDPNV